MTSKKWNLGPFEGSRKVGTHKDCGGEVLYSWRGTMGWRTCTKCGQSSLKGTAPEVEKV